VEGQQRLTATQILGTAGLVVGQSVGYRDVQRALGALFRTGQFDDVRVEQREGPNGELVLAIVVRERPVLERWTVRGVVKVGERVVKDRVSLPIGRAIDRAAVARSLASIDSLYRERGYYRASIKMLELPQPNGKVRVVFDVQEGNRVALSQVAIAGNDQIPDKKLVGQMRSHPEGFWWFRTGEINDDEVQRDLRERLPSYYAERGYIDFQVTHDSLAVDSASGKAALQLQVDEGQRYQVGPRHRGASLQPDRMGRRHHQGADPLRQQRLHLRPRGTGGGAPHPPRRDPRARPDLADPGRAAGHHPADRHPRQRRHP
jgi:outer membrane protein insertion porin family